MKLNKRVNLIGKRGDIWSSPASGFFPPHFSLTIFCSVQAPWRAWQRLVTRLHKCLSAWCISVLSAGRKVDPPLQACTFYSHPVMRVAAQLHPTSSLGQQQHCRHDSPLRRSTCVSWKTRYVWHNEWLRVPLPVHGGSGVSAPGPTSEDT